MSNYENNIAAHAAMEHIEIDENLLYTKVIAIMIVKW